MPSAKIWPRTVIATAAVQNLLGGDTTMKGSRKPAGDLAGVVEDLIKLLDGVSAQLQRGKSPPDSMAQKTAAVLRAVADDLDV